ncbi:MAG: aldose 1-epimerase family protein [Planctomycetota bacterium]
MTRLLSSIVLALFICLHGNCFAQREHIVTSVDMNVSTDDGEIFSSSQFSDRAGSMWSVSKRTLHGGLQEGVELIEVDNGKLKFSVIPTRGMSVYRIASDELTLGWDSPVEQIVHPSHVDLNDHGGLGWLTGFNEFMVRCGVSFAGHPGEDDGKMLTLHGRIGNIPASEVIVSIDEAAPHRIRVRGKVEERMFKFGVFELWTEVSTIPCSNTVMFQDTLINRSDYAQEYQIIYHTNIGRPLLQEDAKFVAPVKSLSPFDDYAANDLDSYQTYLGPTENYGEQVYCLELNADEYGIATVMLHNAAGTQGMAMSYAVESLPYFTLWKNTDTESDGYVTGLEPGTGFPYNRSVERPEGRVPTLDPGASVEFKMEVTLLPDSESVQAVAELIAEIQGAAVPEVNQQPPKTPVEEGER